MGHITLPETLYVDGVPYKPDTWTREMHGYCSVRLCRDGQAVREDRLPVDWIIGGCQTRIFTGGHWYSTKPGGDLTPPN